MKAIKTIIVDDELDSRQSLRTFLTKYCPDVKIVGEAEAIDPAQKLIQDLEPDLVFLDIEMPFGNAFDLLERIPAIDFEFIFVTAYSEYAMQALNLSAAHYLLKPLSIDALVKAVEKVKERLQQQQDINHTKILLENLSGLKAQHQKVVLPLIDGFEVVRLQEIIYCEAQDNFTCFYLTNNKKALICRKLKFYESLLGEYGFCRIHRSFMVNLEYVKRYVKGKGGTVILENGTQLQVANTRKTTFLEQFQ